MERREELRAQAKARRESISLIGSAELSARIAERVITLPAYAGAKRVLCYAARTGEVMTSALIQEILRSGRELYLPVVAPGRRMDAVRLSSLDALSPGHFGILEPVGGEVARPETLDLALVPGLSFDLEGNRLGYGAGYYDRYLPCAPNAARVALAFEGQLTDAIPPGEHDVPMDLIVTEKAIYDCAAARAERSRGK